MSRAKKLDLEAIRKQAEDAAVVWLDECGVEQRVRLILDKDLKEIVAKLLGFDLRYGGWHVDHCNSRSGESAAGDYIRSAASAGVKEWLDQIVGCLPPPPRGLRKSMIAFYHERLKREMEEILVRRAREEARNEVESIIASAASLRVKPAEEPA